MESNLEKYRICYTSSLGAEDTFFLISENIKDATSRAIQYITENLKINQLRIKNGETVTEILLILKIITLKNFREEMKNNLSTDEIGKEVKVKLEITSTCSIS